MGYGLKLAAIFTCVAMLFVSGMLLFTKGFLLKRIVIDDKSKCNETIPWLSTRYPITLQAKIDDVNRGCWVGTRFNKAVIIVIDALRYDFAQFNESLSDGNALPFQNKLSVFQELLKSSPQHSRLYRFIADPPTTTMQRLKGLTTGSLPTFVDAGSNFASYTITEDNIISKLIEHGRKITFMGDDTWEGLFPNSFHKSFPFPSFNVKDLHTVDNGVIKHLVPELKNNDWDVIIGHFLGVDHCGHKYGPYHRAMADKLRQMDNVLRSVIDVLDDKTVLFVLGDHGMTRTGDHGGDSDDELDAALFIYSKAPLIESHLLNRSSSASISQVDFVPTFSLLLGIPIPFCSLGSAMTELFTKQSYQFYIPNNVPSEKKLSWVSFMRQLKILHLNAFQVNRYLHKYQEKSREIPKLKLKTLQTKLEVVSQLFHQTAQFAYYGKTNSSIDLSIEGLKQIEAQYMNYLSEVKELCHGMWAKFDLTSIAQGIIMQVISGIVMIMIILNPHFFRKVSSSLLKGTTVLTLFGAVFCFVVTPTDVPKVFFHILLCFSVSFVSAFLFYALKGRTFLCKDVRICKLLGVQDVLATLLCGSYFMSWFSNSYIVHEDITVSFVVSSLVLLQLIVTFIKSRAVQNVSKIAHRNSAGITKKNKKETQKFEVKNLITSGNFRIIMYVLVFVICGRLSAAFKTCREEQFSCEPSSFLQPLLALQGTNSSINERFLLSSLCVVMVPFALYQWLRFQGNLNGSTPVILSVRYGLPFAAFFICMHWALQILPQTSNNQFPNLQFWQQIILPQFVYWLCLLTILLVLWQPLCLYTLLRDSKICLKESLNNLVVGDTLDPTALKTVFREVKKNWDKMSPHHVDAEDDSSPVVYGLGTVYSSPVLIITSCSVMVIMTVLSDGMAGSMVLLLTQMFLFSEIHATSNTHADKSILEGLSWHAVVVWGLISSQYFFATGHQATIPAIRFEAAFVGLPGDMNNLALPGLLIFLNTFASTVLFAVGLPLLYLWPRISNRLLGKNSPKLQKDGDKGEFDLSNDAYKCREDIFRLLMMYLLFNSLKVLFCACSAGLHRRHLMVWKIFAPRFVFECASFLVSVPFLVFIYLLILRTDCALEKWTEKLEKVLASKIKLS